MNNLIDHLAQKLIYLKKSRDSKDSKEINKKEKKI